MGLIIDWEKKNSIKYRKYIKSNLVDGIEKFYYYHPKRVTVENITFRNFPNIHIGNNSLINCNFKDCQQVFLTAKCNHATCKFNNFKKLICTGKSLRYCEFINGETSDNALVEIEDCEIFVPDFKNIKLFGDAYLVHGHGISRVAYYKLTDVSCERSDSEIFHRDEENFFDFACEFTEDI